MSHLMTTLILQLSVLVVASQLCGWVFSRYLRLPKVLGELAAGMIVGPYLLGSIYLSFLEGPLFPVVDNALPVSPELYGFATFASIILLFYSGLETDLKTFLRFSGTGSLVGIGGVVFSFVFGNLAAVFFLPGVEGFLHPTALFLGTLSTATSIGITARILSERNRMSTPEGVTIMAAAVLDDVIGIVLLAVVVGISRIVVSGGDIHWGSISLIAAKAVGFWLATTVLGILLAPRLSRRIKLFESNEMIAALSFGIALFLSGLSELAGLAMIIGAYVTGLSLSRTDISFEIRERIQGLYDFIVPVFFAVMGMMVDFSSLRPILGFGIIFALLAMAGKMLGCGLPALAAGFNTRGAVRIGAGMLPRGEVTLIVAGVGLASGAIGQDVFGVAVMTLLVASVVSPPFLVRSFEGGPGYKRSLLDSDSSATKTIRLEFPSLRMCSYVIDEIQSGFRSEGFFIHRVDRGGNLFSLRNDDIQVTLEQKDCQISLYTDADNEPFVRLLLIEVLLDLKEFVRSMEEMKSPSMMGAELFQEILQSEEG